VGNCDGGVWWWGEEEADGSYLYANALDFYTPEEQKRRLWGLEVKQKRAGA